jgi:cytochrome oxidase Cu insertion factor (SCO1/SenC/PrrC family)
MKTPPRPRLARPGLARFALILALAALTGCSSQEPAGSGRGAASTEASAAGEESGIPSSGFDGALLPEGRAVHGFTLFDQSGRRVSLDAERGRVTILAFLYTTSRTTAPLIAQQIRGALDELPAGTPAIAISVDPARDTRARGRAFLRAASLTSRMEYLNGPPAQLRRVWRAYGVTPASAGAQAYERAAFVLVLDRSGAPRVEFPLEQLTPEALAHDVRRLQGK